MMAPFLHLTGIMVVFLLGYAVGWISRDIGG